MAQEAIDSDSMGDWVMGFVTKMCNYHWFIHELSFFAGFYVSFPTEYLAAAEDSVLVIHHLTICQ